MKVFKVLLGCLLGILNTGLLVTSKVSVVYLLTLKGHPELHDEQWYAAVWVLLLVPEVLAFLVLLWNTSFLVQGELLKWPSLAAALAGIVVSILEAASLTAFAFEVGPSLPTYVLVPVLGAVMSLSCTLRSWKQKGKKKSNFPVHPQPVESSTSKKNSSCGKRVVMVVLPPLSLLLIIGISCLLAGYSVIKISTAVCLALSVIALSFVWCPCVQLFSLRSSNGKYDGRNRGSLVYTVFKIAALFFGTIVVVLLNYNGVTFVTAAYGLKEGLSFVYQDLLFYPVLITCLGGMGSHGITHLSTYTNTAFAGVTVPAMLATPITSGACIYMCVFKVFPNVTDQTCSFSTLAYVAFILAGLGWMIPFVLFGVKLQKSSRIYMKPRHEMYISCTWNNLFLDQHNMLSYKYDGIHKPYYDNESDISAPESKTSRVFVCTTMYREADYEMERLLCSLQRLALSKRLNNVYLESHLFLDNGAKKRKLTEFALQLLSLLESKLEVHKLDCVTSETPYGLQLQWVLPGNMPFFVHLKDSSKFKAKKRWSQVMYMKYILSYRVKKNSERWNITELGAHTDFYKIRKNASASTLDTICIDEIRLRLSGSMASLDEISRNSALENTEDEATKGLGSRERRGSATSIDQGIEMGDEQSSLSSDTSSANKNKGNRPKEESGSTGGKEDGFTTKVDHTEETAGMCNPAFEADDACSESQSSDRKRNSNGSDDCGVIMKIDDLQRASTPCNSPVSIVIEDISEPSEEEAPSIPHSPSQPDLIPSVFTMSGSSVDDHRYDIPEEDAIDDQTYILATDADMEFKDTSLLSVLKTCNEDKRLGGACGRTCPVGKKNGPIVWFQMFEYAKDFWMIKSAQNVIGSVMCCPGCFSLYRASALEQALVEYEKPTEKPFDVFIKDTGEDRWMCTLMMMQGWRLKYESTSVNTTHCPDKFGEFLKQRRRWILSDMANTILVSKNLRSLSLKNPCFSLIYILYMLQMFVVVLLSPGSTIIMLTAGLDMVLHIPFMYTTPIYGLCLVFYTLVCVSRYTKLQTYSTMVLLVLLAVNIAIVVIGGGIFIMKDIMKDIAEGTLQFQEHYILIMLMASLIYAALLHPRETWILVHGLYYMLFFPAMHILLPLYAISNIVDQSWGTRDNQKAKIPKISCFPIRRKLKKKKKAKKTGAKKTGETEHVHSVFPSMADGSYEQQDEFRFWSEVRDRFLGIDVNLGLNLEDMASGLRKLRLKAVIGILSANGLWLVCLSVLYWYTSEGYTKVNAYGLICGVLYGFSFTVQVLGMTTYRVKVAVNFLANMARDVGQQIWVTEANRAKSK